MTAHSPCHTRRPARGPLPILGLTLTLAAAGSPTVLASSSGLGAQNSARMMDTSSTAPNPDPRLTLKGGWLDAGEASWNMRLVGTARPSDAFFNPSGATDGITNSDIAFTGHYVVQGNYSGFQIWDVSNPSK